MGTGLGAQVGLGKDDDIQRLCEPFVEQLRLVQAGLDVLHRSLFEVLPWYVVVIHLAAIFAMGPPPGIGADVREVQSGIASCSLEIRCRFLCSAICRAWWLPKCPSSTK